MDLLDEAAGFIAGCIEKSAASSENAALFTAANTEKAGVFYLQGQFDALIAHCRACISAADGANSLLYTLLGHGLSQKGEHEQAAFAYQKAFALADAAPQNGSASGIIAKNAANAFELSGRGDLALDYFLSSGTCFLRAGNNDDLGAIIPRLLALGAARYTAHALAGKWAYAVGDFERAQREFA